MEQPLSQGAEEGDELADYSDGEEAGSGEEATVEASVGDGCKQGFGSLRPSSDGKACAAAGRGERREPGRGAPPPWTAYPACQVLEATPQRVDWELRRQVEADWLALLGRMPSPLKRVVPLQARPPDAAGEAAPACGAPGLEKRAVPFKAMPPSAKRMLLQRQQGPSAAPPPVLTPAAPPPPLPAPRAVRPPLRIAPRLRPATEVAAARAVGLRPAVGSPTSRPRSRSRSPEQQQQQPQQQLGQQQQQEQRQQPQEQQQPEEQQPEEEQQQPQPQPQEQQERKQEQQRPGARRRKPKKEAKPGVVEVSLSSDEEPSSDSCSESPPSPAAAACPGGERRGDPPDLSPSPEREDGEPAG